MVHLTRQPGSYAPPRVVHEQLTINLISPSGKKIQSTLRWLGIWFGRILTLKRHVAIRNAKTAWALGTRSNDDSVMLTDRRN